MSATQATFTSTQVAVKYRWNVSSLSIDMSADNRRATLVDISTDMSVECRSRYRPTIDRYVDRHISIDISAECRSICRPTYRSSIGRYVDRYIGGVSVDKSTDISVEGCTKYT